MKQRITKWTVRLLAWLLFGHQWSYFLTVAESVSVDPRIPIYGSDQVRYGREARRDEAAFRMGVIGKDLSDSQINLGCELAHWWRKLGNK